jgi:hypothetical protein
LDKHFLWCGVVVGVFVVAAAVVSGGGGDGGDS